MLELVAIGRRSVIAWIVSRNAEQLILRDGIAASDAKLVLAVGELDVLDTDEIIQ